MSSATKDYVRLAGDKGLTELLLCTEFCVIADEVLQTLAKSPSSAKLVGDVMQEGTPFSLTIQGIGSRTDR